MEGSISRDSFNNYSGLKKERIIKKRLIDELYRRFTLKRKS